MLKFKVLFIILWLKLVFLKLSNNIFINIFYDGISLLRDIYFVCRSCIRLDVLFKIYYISGRIYLEINGCCFIIN